MLKCWYGFIYTDNRSPYTLEETMKPRLDGLEVIYPLDAANDHLEIVIEPWQ